MSFMDSITGGIAEQLKGQSGGQGNVLSAAMQLMNSPEIGGPVGMAQALAKQGQGDVVTSWISTGKNLPISPDALLKLFGQEKIHQLASGMGMSIPSLLSGLTVVLPEMINKLSPAGSLPSNREAHDTLGELAKSFFRN